MKLETSCLAFPLLYRTINIAILLKKNFLKLSPPWVAREFLFARRNRVLALTPLFSANFTDSQNYAPTVRASGGCHAFLPKSESKWGLSRANTTAARQKGGVNFKKSDFTKKHWALTLFSFFLNCSQSIGLTDQN
eukprot:sb/3474683/